MQYNRLMQFQVPQFLEVEDKLFAFLTFKQFLFLLGGGAMLYLSYAYLPGWLVPIAFLLIVPFTAALSFLKVNKKPFIYFIESFFKYAGSARLYIWKKVPKKAVSKKDAEDKRESPPAYIPRLSENKLKELAWTLDIRSRSSNEAF